ncbi:MAG: hypothetical protein WCA46_22505, partial [Actinocatenispora sp.]
ERTTMSVISFEELNLLAGEMLPERAVLSTVTPFAGGAEHGNVAVVHESSSPTIASACQAVNNGPLAGIAGGDNSLTCVPAAIAG